MPSLSGNLIDVTSAPSDATEVWIRAADGRVSGANVVLEESRRVPVNAGEFTVTVLPGRAHLVVIHAGMSQEHVPLLVQDGMTTIAEAVRLGAADWEEYSPSQAEQIKAEIAAEVAKAATSAQAAKNAQQAAEKARTDTQNALSTKADKVHTHALADVTGLQAALNGKANTSHTHTTAQVTGLQSALDGKADKGHMHATSEVAGLDSALAGKAQGPIHFISTTKTSAGEREYSYNITVSGGGRTAGSTMLVPVAGWYLVTTTTDSSDTAYMRITQNGEARLVQYTNGFYTTVLYLSTSDYVQTPLHSTAVGQLIHCVMQRLR